jgi:hypothetical protein
MDEDPHKTIYVPVDMAVDVPVYIAGLGANYQDALLTGGEPLMMPERQIVSYRLPGPATEGDGRYNQGCFVYKGRGPDPQKIHNRANEVGAMRQAAQWAAQGRHEHAHIPALYDSFTDFPRDGTAPTQPVYAAIEFVEGDQYRARYIRTGCVGWSVRQKRSFVRQLALFRLSMMHMRGNRICGVNPDLTPGLMVGHNIANRDVRGGGRLAGGVMDPLYYDNLGPVRSERAWTEQAIRRDMDYWTTEVDAIRMKIMKGRYRSVFDWTPESFRTLVQYHACQVILRRFREPWEELDAPTADFPFCFDHGDLQSGFNIQCFKDSPRIRAIIDWETGMFVPYSWAVRDINPYSTGAGDWDKELKTLREGDMPFGTDIYWDHHIAFWKRENRWKQRTRARRMERARRKGTRISTMNDNDFAAYGKITPRDLMFGDTLDEEAWGEEEPDDLDPFYVSGKRAYVPHRTPIHVEPGTWYYEPVMKLIDDFMQTEMHVGPLCKYLDPYAEQWTTNNMAMVKPP